MDHITHRHRSVTGEQISLQRVIIHAGQLERPPQSRQRSMSPSRAEDNAAFKIYAPEAQEEFRDNGVENCQVQDAARPRRRREDAEA
jgi:hypothetical protein